MAIDFDLTLSRLNDIEPVRVFGRVTRVVGLTVESEGPPASVGEILYLKSRDGDIPLEVIGFRESTLISMPFGVINGITPGQRIFSSGRKHSLSVDESFLGRVINGLGEPIDDLGPLKGREQVQIYREPVNAMKREPVKDVVTTGVKVIDGMITLGKGQRMGIFAGSGVGKSTLMGMIARNTGADVNVIALIGERGRELKDFIINSLGEEGLKRSVVIAATSDESPMIKILAAFTATAVAEYFSDRGLDVMLMMDSITRLAMAQREIGLSAGEPPSTKGYTPSVFTMMPRLLERAGNFSDKGSITGLYTVLVEGDDVNEPVSDHARSILDGHIVLSRELAHRNHYPSIDVLGSISRLMSDVAVDEHKSHAGKIREILAVYREAEDLINIGAYAQGSNFRIDEAVNRIDNINKFLKQGVKENFPFFETIKMMEGLLK